MKTTFKTITIVLLFCFTDIVAQDYCYEGSSFLNNFSFRETSTEAFFLNKDAKPLTKLELNKLFTNTSIAFKEVYDNKFTAKYNKQYDKLIFLRSKNNSLQLLITKKNKSNKILIQNTLHIEGEKLVSVFWKTPKELDKSRVLVVLTKDKYGYYSNIIFATKGLEYCLNQLIYGRDGYHRQEKGGYVLASSKVLNESKTYEQFNKRWKQLTKLNSKVLNIFGEVEQLFYPDLTSNSILTKNKLERLATYYMGGKTGYQLVGKAFLLDLKRYGDVGVFLNKEIDGTSIYLNFIIPNGDGFSLERFLISIQRNESIVLNNVSFVKHDDFFGQIEINLIKNKNTIKKKFEFSCGASGYCGVSFNE